MRYPRMGKYFPTKNEYDELFEKITYYWKRYLKKCGVKKVRKYTQDANALVLLLKHFKEPVEKSILTVFNNKIQGKNSNDFQRGRHLATEKGFWVASGRRNDIVKGLNLISKTSYVLVSLTKPFPGWIADKRDESELDWPKKKKQWDYRCSLCGAKEGSPHWKKKSIVKLEKGHMDPTKSLTHGNCLPQCQFCNRAFPQDTHFKKDGYPIVK